jgi:hypothetical protein
LRSLAQPKNQKPPFKDPEIPAAVGQLETFGSDVKLSRKQPSVGEREFCPKA